MTIASFCRELLLSHGPLPVEVLADRAAHAGVTTARDPRAAVKGALAYKEVLLADGRYATPLWLLEGRLLTSTAAPVDPQWPDVEDDAWLAGDQPRDVVRWDLALLDAALRSSAIPLASGGLLRRSTYGDTWSVPKGWPLLRPGRHELLGLRVFQGRLHAEVVPVTPELRRAGEQLGRHVGVLRRAKHGWFREDEQVSRDLTAALWERLAADPVFLTSPAPPLSRCIPALATAVRAERARRTAEASRWHVQLDLPAALQPLAVRAARRDGQLVDEWLASAVTRTLEDLHDCGEEDLHDTWRDVDRSWADVVPLAPRRRARR